METAWLQPRLDVEAEMSVVYQLPLKYHFMVFAHVHTFPMITEHSEGAFK